MSLLCVGWLVNGWEPPIETECKLSKHYIFYGVLAICKYVIVDVAPSPPLTQKGDVAAADAGKVTLPSSPPLTPERWRCRRRRRRWRRNGDVAAGKVTLPPSPPLTRKGDCLVSLFNQISETNRARHTVNTQSIFQLVTNVSQIFKTACM